MQVGHRTVVKNEMLLVPEGESVTFDLQLAETEKMKVRIEFPRDLIVDADIDPQAETPNFLIEYELEENTSNIECLVLKFVNFNKSVPQTLTAPQLVAAIDTSGAQVTFLASVQKMGSVNKIDFQFMVGQP